MSTIQVPAEGQEHVAELTRIVRRLKAGNNIAVGVLWVVAAFVTLLFIAIIVYLIARGGTYLLTPQLYGAGDAGLGREIFNSFYILILTEIFLFPIALAAAIYLIEYARQGPLVTSIHFAAETLAGVPSIVLGLFGVAAFSDLTHLGTSRLAGALTLLCLNLPLALRLFEDALAAVPREMREGGLALGATRWRVIRTVVIPSALPGLITGLILSAGKIIGEAAALLFTMGLTSPSDVFTLNPLIASDTLTTHLYFIAGPGAGSTSLSTAQETAISAGSAAILILLLLIINIAARTIGRFIQRKITAA
ncbi:MAG: phosphate ABC transporter permease PstA [Chloroflexi bacterium]|nr:phosphate ABC transporter permease PstA [Chloroflexota bacterium]